MFYMSRELLLRVLWWLGCRGWRCLCLCRRRRRRCGRTSFALARAFELDLRGFKCWVLVGDIELEMIYSNSFSVWNRSRLFQIVIASDILCLRWFPSFCLPFRSLTQRLGLIQIVGIGTLPMTVISRLPDARLFLKYTDLCVGTYPVMLANLEPDSSSLFCELAGCMRLFLSIHISGGTSD